MIARLALCVGVVLAAFAAASDPVAWKVQNAPSQPVKPGAPFTVKLVAAIEKGWHVYSMRPIDDGPVPTRVWLAEGQPFQMAGPVKAEDPESVEDATLQKEVELYEGEAWFELPVKASVGASAGAQKMTVSVSFQSCNNKMCLPPKTVRVDVPVTVGK